MMFSRLTPPLLCICLVFVRAFRTDISPSSRSIRRRRSQLPFSHSTSGIIEKQRDEQDFLGESSITLLEKQSKPIDKRPYEQRLKAPRKSRRMNHSFMHLYRHDSAQFDDQKLAHGSISLTSPKAYLLEYAGLSNDDLESMTKSFPPLLEMDVKRHLRPKLRFLKHTLEAEANGQVSTIAKIIPPHYFGSRLEKTVAPRHAFLMYMGLPHGPTLLQNDGELFREFFVSHRKTKSFCAMCNQWSNRFGRKYADPLNRIIDDEIVFAGEEKEEQDLITSQFIDSFDSLFQRGLMAAARNDMDPQNQYLKNCNIASDQIINLLVRHGANPMETDIRDISLLHWAAGTGNKDGLIELVRSLPGGFGQAIFKMKAERDGATILHWAAAGAKPKEFGCGGHIDICRYVMDSCGSPTNERDAVNTLTKDGNSVLMWAAWSGTIDVVKLLIRHRADATVRNRNGCTVAHWAASGGNLEVCRYLFDVVKVDFSVRNLAENTPLSHAVAYGRFDVAQWLREEICVEDDDDRAKDLAVDFIDWDSNDERRKNIFNLFNNDW